MKEKFSKLIDVKSIVTLMLVFTLVFIVIFTVLKTSTIDEKLFLLFSNIVTMVITYFFTKKKDEHRGDTESEDTK